MTKEYEEYIKINGILDILFIGAELKGQSGIEYRNGMILNSGLHPL